MTCLVFLANVQLRQLITRVVDHPKRTPLPPPLFICTWPARWDSALLPGCNRGGGPHDEAPCLCWSTLEGPGMYTACPGSKKESTSKIRLLPCMGGAHRGNALSRQPRPAKEPMQNSRVYLRGMKIHGCSLIFLVKPPREQHAVSIS